MIYHQTLSLSLSDIPNRNLLEMIELPSSLDSSHSWGITQMGPKNRLSFTGLSFAGLHLIFGWYCSSSARLEAK